ncbi:unnamed protein product [Mycena citricolor]|uniref:Peptidase S53 activation domain-containing protein n=1 Tax=Mycena citricolor TaxID=2018698 RepID=A0AAD2K4T5_9AGAR|nr:unnamed protein product [Mycena citricolor]
MRSRGIPIRKDTALHRPAVSRLQPKAAGLAPNDPGGLAAKLTDIATLGSTRFCQWLSKEVRSRMAPSAATVSAFMVFASAHGLNTTHVSPNGHWVSATVSVAMANKLFNATFELFSHPSLSGKIARTMSVSLPSKMVDVVNVIHPTTAFALPQATSRSAQPLMIQMDLRKGKSHVAALCNTSNPSGVITPQCLLDIYGIPGIFLGGRGGLEAELDMQYGIGECLGGVANGVPTNFLSVGGYNFLGALLDTANSFDGASSPPTVLSTSYGVDELDTDHSMARFLNPSLYKNPAVFNDITVGHNSGFLCPEMSVAFEAVRGWGPLREWRTENVRACVLTRSQLDWAANRDTALAKSEGDLFGRIYPTMKLDPNFAYSLRPVIARERALETFIERLMAFEIYDQVKGCGKS